jgi:hypothetical protein
MNKLTPDDAFELGNQFRDAAILLGDWRTRNRSNLMKPEWDELDDREIRLLNTASSIYTSANGLVLLDSHAAVVHLQSSVKAAKSAAQHFVTPKQALDLASALILFAAAVSFNNGAAIPAAIVALDDAPNAIVHRAGSGGA